MSEDLVINDFKKNRSIYYIKMMNTDFIIIILLVVLILVFFFNPSQNLVNMESFTTSENIEAIQNLASMYENGKLNVTDLNVSGNLNATNLNVSSNLNVNGQTNLKNTKILGSGSIGGEKEHLGFDDAGNITTGNITAYGEVSGTKGFKGDIVGESGSFSTVQLKTLESGNSVVSGGWTPIYTNKADIAFLMSVDGGKRKGFGFTNSGGFKTDLSV